MVSTFFHIDSVTIHREIQVVCDRIRLTEIWQQRGVFWRERSHQTRKILPLGRDALMVVYACMWQDVVSDQQLRVGSSGASQVEQNPIARG